MARIKKEQIKCTVEMHNLVSNSYGYVNDGYGGIGSETILSLLLSLPNGRSIFCDLPLRYDKDGVLQKIFWIDKDEETSYAYVTVETTEKEEKGKVKHYFNYYVEALYLKHTCI